MKKYNKVFKNRQILTSEEMNDIIDVINDIIGQFNEANSDDKYFKLYASQETIETNVSTNVVIGVKELEGAGDIRSVKIYWDRDGFEQALNDYAETSVTVTISGTTTFRATLAVAEVNNLVTKSLVINAVSPTYIGSGETQEDVVMANGQVTSRAQKFNYLDKVTGEVHVNIYKGEDLYFFVPSGVNFDIDEIYLDSIVFPVVALTPRIINGIDYRVFRSAGGECEDTKNGFAEDMDITLTIL
jgi:hypothetical protein